MSFKLEIDENKEYVVLGMELVPIEFYMEVDDQEEEEEEDDDDLFEIDLDVVDYITPRDYYWDCAYFVETTNHHALLANCMLPISDISSAVPAAAAKPPSRDHHHHHHHRATLMSWVSWPSEASFWRCESSMAEDDDEDFMGFCSFDSFEFPQYSCLEAIRP